MVATPSELVFISLDLFASSSPSYLPIRGEGNVALRPHLKGGQVQVEQLWQKAGAIQREALQPGSEDWSETDQKLWEVALEEVGSSLRGPFTREQVSNEVGSNIWVPSRRFAINQKQKVRPIDDFSEHSVK